MTTVNIKQNGEEVEVNLADIANINMNDVQEFEGFEATPKGVYLWEVKDAGIDSTDKGRAYIYFDLEVIECLGLVVDDRTPESMTGAKHRESIFIADVEKGVGQAKAIMTNAGFKGQGSLEQLLDAFCGTRFVAPVKQRKNPNDTDQVFANLDIRKIKPVPTEGLVVAG